MRVFQVLYFIVLLLKRADDSRPSQLVVADVITEASTGVCMKFLGMFQNCLQAHVFKFEFENNITTYNSFSSARTSINLQGHRWTHKGPLS